MNCKASMPWIYEGRGGMLFAYAQDKLPYIHRSESKDACRFTPELLLDV
jgi:hypothetical protein